MIVALTPNPALDRLVIVPGFRTATVTRVAEVRETAGGKGLNVVRAARALGAAVRAVGPLGGATGRYVADLAAREGLDAQWAWVAAGETRTCTLVADLATHDTLALNERGPDFSPEDWRRFTALAHAQTSPTLVTCSGSLPPQVTPTMFTAFLAALAACGTPIMLDTSGAALAGTLGLPLALIKANQHEIAEALHVAVTSLDDAARVARRLIVGGPAQIMITLGAAGALLATNSGEVWHARPPDVEIVSDVGSGDAALAAFAVAALRGDAAPVALRHAVACGTANALLPGPAMFSLDTYAQCVNDVVVERLS